MPTRSGWCTLQNTSTSASRSGIQAVRPSGSMFTSSASSRLPQMKTGLAGSSSCWPGTHDHLARLLSCADAAGAPPATGRGRDLAPNIGAQHHHVARAVHQSLRRAGDARKAGVGAALDLLDLGHRQARRVDAVHAAGGEHVARLHVRVAGHEAQLERAAVRRWIAVGHAARAGAGVEHRNRLLAVDHQRHLADQRIAPA